MAIFGLVIPGGPRRALRTNWNRRVGAPWALLFPLLTLGALATVCAQCDPACATCTGPDAHECIVANGWTQQTAAGPFGAPIYAPEVVISRSGRVLLILGAYLSTHPGPYDNAIWASDDRGASWSLVNGDALPNVGTLAYHACAVVPSSGRIVCYGGTQQDGANSNTVFHSDDEGLTVTVAAASAAGISARRRHRMVALGDDTLLTCAGYTSAHLRTCSYSTDDGLSWTAQPTPAWGARNSPALVVLEGNVVIIAGGTGSSHYRDVWSSSDAGATWTALTASAPWHGRYEPNLWAHGNTLVLAGGLAGATTNDMWVSTDGGASWSPRGNAPWPRRSYGGTATFANGVMMLVTGRDAGADAWSFDLLSACDTKCATCPDWAPADCITCAAGYEMVAGVCASTEYKSSPPCVALLPAAAEDDAAAACARGMVEVAQLHVSCINANSRAIARLVSPVPGSSERGPFSIQRDAHNDTLFHLVLRKAVDPGLHEVHVVVSKQVVAGGHVTNATRTVKLRGNVSCPAGAPVAQGDSTSIAYTRVQLQGVNPVVFTTGDGADAHKAAFELAVARALGVNATAATVVGVDGGADAAIVRVDVRVPAEVLPSSKVVHLALDARTVGAVSASTAVGQRRLTLAMEHAGRTISRALGVCCRATVEEVVDA